MAIFPAGRLAVAALLLFMLLVTLMLVFQLSTQMAKTDVSAATNQKLEELSQHIETLSTRVSWLERGRLDDQHRVKQIQDDATTLMKQIAMHADNEMRHGYQTSQSRSR